MSVETINEEDWKKRELKRITRFTEMDEIAMRRGWSLSDVLKLMYRPSSPRNFLSSPPFSQVVPEHSLGVSARSESTVQSDSSQRRRFADRVEDLEGRHMFDFEALRNPFEEDLDPTEGVGDDGLNAESERTIGGLEDSEQESVMKATFLDDSDEDDEDEEAGDAEESSSDEDYFYDAIIFRRETSDHQNPLVVEELQDEEPLFAEDLFADPLKALEDQ
ncbi:hypothetical protein DSL72_005543 [Monilinia vaccinii-corymbosi]|uniref:Uncharacterized protein n=1 Tax=Monilinia vaccinii-corymbosi TaxID=61207 RepID=A0A8A3PFY9_9HELO|nr:hypothetical protein DSL72_005543 [Monilinia vaccinii-corymbosi]